MENQKNKENCSIFNLFEISFDAGSEPLFHGGERITGTVKVNLNEQVTIKAIKLQFKGRAAWRDDASSKSGEVEKVFFDKDFVLLERPPGHPEPGHFLWKPNYTYSLPFECPLPKGCPTSYESPNAFIRYFARITFQTDDVLSVQYTAKKGFTVICPPDNNKELVVPSKINTVGANETCLYGGCCCRGKLQAEVTLPKNVYFPGEKVLGTFKVQNKSSKNFVEKVDVRLVDKATLVDGDVDGTKTVMYRTLVLRKLEKNDAIKKKKNIAKDDVEYMTIPPVIPTTFWDGEDDNIGNDKNYSLSYNKTNMMDSSPSIATLKFRKTPFIKIEYCIQVTFGDQILLELPIIILPLPTEGINIEYKEFPLGPQEFSDSDENDKTLIGGPFKYAPIYPVLINADEVIKQEVESIQAPDTPTHLILEVPENIIKREPLEEIPEEVTSKSEFSKESDEPETGRETIITKIIEKKENGDVVKEIIKTTTEITELDQNGDIVVKTETLIKVNNDSPIEDKKELHYLIEHQSSPTIEISNDNNENISNEKSNVKPLIEEPDDDVKIGSDNDSSILNVVIDKNEKLSKEDNENDDEGNIDPNVHVEKIIETKEEIDDDGNTVITTIEKVITTTSTDGQVSAEEAKGIFNEMIKEDEDETLNGNENKTVETYEEIDEDGNRTIVIHEKISSTTHMVSTATKANENGKIDVSTAVEQES
ncbi:Arrestin-like, N-terminal domain and Arrestin C-terminal-like domain and Arrestin, C-terminal domain and Immunoglobulin E-set domain-containing protein [Strongyloides ratti]|uniref:Arrestin-like, N-terminal domain and Arrestin C-terminal-like domain and Arrestin, C-terminal domain and Immunoglobulin E-set domain-containing protein n=1 Tax=Strongyloides ratti TaxID=34506 RepID=A0A090MZR0_STRRB|nr:Arrestin-like, N-terminal domain and Arrestin C-terminal-like domain and Arrestin, C-terminal domain and Immunoglobulin E-set domain-containing protein [Strongyloides ratti]CEF69369.1 Arrestin-like, N-terminal domain and Arrestin C-terminal-like domain and Arrestin, C-terminal domain and Immunoglobulin E-set domain-containing protein [Strongyloides ratti]